MREVSYFVAASLDGYIARADGAIDWLFTDQDYGYSEFVAGVDTVLLGRKTFEQCDAFGDPFPYAGLRTVVFSRTLAPQAAALARRRAQGVEIEVEAGDPAAAVRALKVAPGRGGGGGHIWLVGGSELAAPLMEAGLVGEMVISLHPILLGDGVPLFRKGRRESQWTLVSAKTFDTGLAQLAYRLRPEAPAGGPAEGQAPPPPAEGSG